MRLLGLLALATVFSCAGNPTPKAPTTTEPDPAGLEVPEHHAPGRAHGPLGHRFDDAAHWAKRWDSLERDAYQKPASVIELMEIEEGMTVVDLGVGTGYFVPHLSRAVGPAGKVIGLDIEPAMVAHVQERAEREQLSNVTVKRVPFDDPELEVGGVDRVLIVNTWHHVPERVEYLRKLSRALQPGGSIYIVDFTMDSDIGPPVEQRLETELVIDELRSAGMIGRVVKEELPKQWLVVADRVPPREGSRSGR